MKATRTIPARPINDGETVAVKVTDLVAMTLDRSPHLEAGSIRDELASAQSALALLGSGGHLRRGELVLVAPGLRLRIDVPVGEDAIAAAENTDPPRGAGTATTWTLHLPVPDGLAAMVRSVAQSCPNVSTDPAPDDEPEVQSHKVAETIDLSRLATGGEQR